MTETIVVKAGGEIVESGEYLEYLSNDLLSFQMRGDRLALVYGAKKRITDEMTRLYKSDSKFRDGLRVTDDRTLVAFMSAMEILGENIKYRLKQHGCECKLFDGGIYAVMQEEGYGYVGDPIGIKDGIKSFMEHGIAIVSCLV